ncbi:MAG: hypothetical protein CVV64_01100 [Candidatus Wallbacteria bacterium HGW-Wallbacteria-1]|uniref:DUF4340 domain-containing protein n=1 Tax=Candidatus Wallbacteria bacterium HGW-Wallbacteria-1 TaxID=2013854 RepID=A0A2N1PUR4_9BACT|nr:MAG: hypothetical protein CVV64_01100 [Candidatus Wallbacteria bacterium HGW-Wallbacteria-1]
MKLNIILTLLIAVLLTINLMISSEDVSTENPILLSVPCSDVLKLTLQDKSGTHTLSHFDGKWIISVTQPFPADPEQSEGLFAAIANLEVMRQFEPGEMDSMGESEFSRKVSVEFRFRARGDKEAPGNSVIPIKNLESGSLTLRIGPAAPAGRGYYARVAGFDRTLLISASQLDFLFTSPEELRDRRIMADNSYVVTQVEIETDSAEFRDRSSDQGAGTTGFSKSSGDRMLFRASRTADREWLVDSPYSWAGDWKVIYGLCYRMESTRALLFSRTLSSGQPLNESSITSPENRKPDLVFRYLCSGSDGLQRRVEIPFWKTEEAVQCRSNVTGAMVTVEPSLYRVLSLHGDASAMALMLAAPFNHHRVQWIGLSHNLSGTTSEFAMSRSMDDFQWQALKFAEDKGIRSEISLTVDPEDIDIFLRYLASMEIAGIGEIGENAEIGEIPDESEMFKGRNIASPGNDQDSSGSLNDSVKLSRNGKVEDGSVPPWRNREVQLRGEAFQWLAIEIHMQSGYGKNFKLNFTVPGKDSAASLSNSLFGSAASVKGADFLKLAELVTSLNPLKPRETSEN